jgi:SUR7/PalI family
MGRVGRFVCVGMPFALTLASLICILIVTLTGVTNNGLFLFKVNTQNLSISTSDLSNLHTRGMHMNLRGSAISSVEAAAGSVNITAADLGLFDSYTISLWNYCYVSGKVTTCVPAKFDWASNATNFTNTLTTVAAENGASFSDSTLINAVKTFSSVIKWSEIVYIIAGALAALELVIGLFAFCSRVGSCCTFLISGFSSAAVIAAAALSTVTAAVVVGAVSALDKFGVSASFNTSFLAISWLAVVFSLAGSFFWLFSICCCAPDRRERRDKHRSRAGDEKPYGGYQRVNDPFVPAHSHGALQQGQELGYIPPMQPGKAQRYEPYSHTSV